MDCFTFTSTTTAKGNKFSNLQNQNDDLLRKIKVFFIVCAAKNNLWETLHHESKNMKQDPVSSSSTASGNVTQNYEAGKIARDDE